MKLTEKNPLGNTGLHIPPVIYGTSYLGNLYRALSFTEKLELVKAWFENTAKPVFIDSAGKYGAGLALEVIGLALDELGVDPGDIIISNKLGWYRIPMEGTEPAFEPGAWAELENDCMQSFGYKGIISCYEQGNELLGGRYRAGVVSVHDPDEYLAAAKDPGDRDQRLKDLLESYRALFDLKEHGEVSAVGIGSKDWNVIRELYEHVTFDWVMFANSFTILCHPPEILEFMEQLYADGVGIVNSAVFHGGFLTGGDKFDYRSVDPGSEEGRYLHSWMESFGRVCSEFGVDAVEACIHFAISHPAIAAIALNTSQPEKMKRNTEILQKKIPPDFWKAMKDNSLVDQDYRYLY